MDNSQVTKETEGGGQDASTSSRAGRRGGGRFSSRGGFGRGRGRGGRASRGGGRGPRRDREQQDNDESIDPRSMEVAEATISNSNAVEGDGEAPNKGQELNDNSRSKNWSFRKQARGRRPESNGSGRRTSVEREDDPPGEDTFAREAYRQPTGQDTYQAQDSEFPRKQKQGSFRNNEHRGGRGGRLGERGRGRGGGRSGRGRSYESPLGASPQETGAATGHFPETIGHLDVHQSHKEKESSQPALQTQEQNSDKPPAAANKYARSPEKSFPKHKAKRDRGTAKNARSQGSQLHRSIPVTPDETEIDPTLIAEDDTTECLQDNESLVSTPRMRGAVSSRRGSANSTNHPTKQRKEDTTAFNESQTHEHKNRAQDHRETCGRSKKHNPAPNDEPAHDTRVTVTPPERNIRKESISNSVEAQSKEMQKIVLSDSNSTNITSRTTSMTSSSIEQDFNEQESLIQTRIVPLRMDRSPKASSLSPHPLAILKKSNESATRSISILKRLANDGGDSIVSLKTDMNESRLVEQIALADVVTDDIVEYVKPSAETGKHRPRKTSSRLKLDSSLERQSIQEVKANEDAQEEAVVEAPEKQEAVMSVTEALAALPAQEVSITASTSLVRTASGATLSTNVSRSSSASNLKKSAAPVRRTKSKKGTGSHKTKDPNDAEANARKAMLFNRAVRDCVDNSDPDKMRHILRDPAHKHYALDATVLETVMTAYVMAAMFEDALYCLRRCALPGTLSAQQSERILTCLPQNLRNSSAFVAADMINALAIATEFESAKKRTYFLRIVRGIALEFLEEATSARDRICSAPCERLIRSALCVVEAQFKRGKKTGELIVLPGNQLGVFVPENNFMDNRGIQTGDAVSILPYSGPYPMSAESLDRNMIEATVSSTSPTMVLKLQEKTNASLIQVLTEPNSENVYRIDKLANRMGFNRQLAAAVAVSSKPSEAETSLHRKAQRRPCPELVHAITAMDENIDRMIIGAANGKYNTRRYAPNSQNSTAAICSEAIPIWVGTSDDEDDSQETIRDKSRLLLDKYNALDGLNASQKLAIEGATTNRLTLIQGPPGSGKTRIAIRILQHWTTLASYEEGEGSPILATSDSNIAVDNLVEGCANAGLRVIRIGRPEAVRPELLRYCIDRPGSNSSSNLQSMEQDGTGQYDGYHGSMTSLSALYYKERLQKLKSAHVICCTCIGSGSDILDSICFERVLVDEATQATEPAVLVPLTRGCRQLVLVGDHCQLPPTVLSTRAEEEGLGVPLFSRLVACGVPPFMLDTQYRMHPSIAMFPSDLFYGGKLLNGVSAPERRPLAGFPWPRMEFPVAFVPVNHGIEMDDGQSKFNEAEAAAACDAVAALLQGGQCTVTDIAVVTPYAAQVRLLRRLLRKLVQHPPYVEVSSVDGFQGREKEAVIFSAVRSNDYGAVGFVSDWRRVNVSFTRARRALIVIGNEHTLRRGDPDTWLPWLAWADAHGLNMDKPGIPRGRYDSEQMRRVRGGTTAAEMLKHVLQRQQAQLKVAEQQLQKAERNAVGHIMGQSDDDQEEEEEEQVVDTHEDLAKLANVDGCWDDSDDEHIVDLKAVAFKPSASKASSFCSTDDKGTSDEEPAVIEDAWDL